MAEHVLSRIDEPVHIILGDSAAGTLRGCQAIILTDNLAWGPSHPDRVRHGDLRKEFWRNWATNGRWPKTTRHIRQYITGLEREIFTAQQLATALQAYSETRPVLLWTAPLWRERLCFWWTLDAIRGLGLDLDRFWVAQPKLSDSPETSLGCFCSEQLDEAFGSRLPLSAGLLRSGAVLWRKYAARSPSAFDEARRNSAASFPDLATVAEIHGWFFPRLSNRSHWLRLSRLDQALLDSLRTGAWIRPIDLLTDRGGFLLEFLHLVGDLLLLSRLDAWASHSPDDPALLSQPAEGASSWTNIAYRLTARGERLRCQGLLHAEEAPSMYVGGCPVYEGTNPWVRRDLRTEWKIERFTRQSEERSR
jgi:hypothetical protein